MVQIDCPYPNCTYQASCESEQLASTLLQIHASGSHNPAVPATTNSAPASSIPKLKRPVISAGGSSEEWSYFLIRWKDYIAATNITGASQILQLLECCDDELRRDVTRSAGGSLANQTEAEVLNTIKSLAIRVENPMVARTILSEMKQDHQEPIRSFSARVRGQASVCQFTAPCSCGLSIDYSDHIIRDVLVQGVADPEIQRDILSDSNQNMSLQELLSFIEKKEAGHRSASRLASQNVSSSRSQYSQNKRTANKTIPSQEIMTDDPCHYCGEKGHGKKSPASIRKSKCRAYNTICQHCKKRHHFASVCQSKPRSPIMIHEQNAAASNPIQNAYDYTQLCSLATSGYLLKVKHSP